MFPGVFFGDWGVGGVCSLFCAVGFLGHVVRAEIGEGSGGCWNRGLGDVG